MSPVVSLPRTDPTSQIAVAAVSVVARRRQEMGDIDALADSMARYGLINPIVVDESGVLMTGGRRLAAAQLLGWDSIPARAFADLSDDEKRAIELEENLRRKDLTPYERSRTTAEIAATAKRIAETETCTDSVQVSKPSRGPARTPGSLRDIAERTGVPAQTIRDARQHVAAAERYPELKLPHIPQEHASTIAASLDALPDDERPALLARVRENDRGVIGVLARRRDVAEPDPAPAPAPPTADEQAQRAARELHAWETRYGPYSGEAAFAPFRAVFTAIASLEARTR